MHQKNLPHRLECVKCPKGGELMYFPQGEVEREREHESELLGLDVPF